MSATDQRLFVFAYLDTDWVPCGQLTLSEDGANLLSCTFAYGLRYLQRPDALEVDPVSLSLRDRLGVRGKALFPPNNLPSFGGIRDAAPDAWGRRVIESRLKVPANSLPESAYLVHAGSQRVGALDIRSARDSSATPGFGSWNHLEYLLEAAQRIDEGLPVPPQLEEIFAEGSALGGARPKATVRDEERVLWLAKFPSRRDTLAIPVIETATLRLAAAAGLTVPQLRLLQLGSRTVMLIRRFDRYWAKAGENASLPENFRDTAPAYGLAEKRLGFVSALTLLACDELDSPDKSYGDLAQAVRRYCHPSVIRDNNRELFERLVFNILVNNDDDHLRNHGFVWDAQLPGWRLSPLYDVVPRASLAAERRLHLGVGPGGRSATLDNAFAGREMFTLSAQAAADSIARVWSIVREWRVYFEQYQVGADQIEKIAPAFRHIDELTTPALRKLLP
ncbi:MAG TPA: HipA domain-containing protein [Steroidobacteraceae bacterium]|jgi:serine/threonine-protein kinase HipA|nr:HipA domain-containing protein [Steroidobacteraceae bacterium]